MIIGDIAFPDTAALEKEKIAAANKWEDKFYWHADKSLSALQAACIQMEYFQVSSCAGEFVLLATQRNNE